MGNTKTGIIIPMIPGHPSRINKMIAIPIKAKGKVNDAKNIGIFTSIMLKSLESMFTTFEISEFFIVYCESADNLANNKDTKPVLSLHPIIGAW